MTIREALMLNLHLPLLDREVLLSHAIGRDRVFLMAHGEDIVAPRTLRRYRDFLARATKHEPIAYITGVREFYGRDFFVGPGVLIPRPETELLVEYALNRIENLELRMRNKKKRIAIVDVGTGSGCVIISLAKEFSSRFKIPDSRFSLFAVDSEEAALRYARKNARHLDINGAIRFMKSDLLSGLKKKLSDYDELFVIANLPYLSSALYRSTAPHVKRYEPKSALLSGKDGFDHYRRLMTELAALNKAGVKIKFFLEISPEQAKKLHSLFTDLTRLSSIEIIPDLAGKSRVVIGVIEKE